MCATFTIPQPCSSRRLVLTFERATPSVAAISSAWRGRADRKRRAWIWATVRLMPHFAPISPQVTTKRSCRGVRPDLAVLSVISVLTEIYDKTGAAVKSRREALGAGREARCQLLATGAGAWR